MSERKLATIRKIDDIQPIKGADQIEVATVGGWKVVVKKGEYNIGDLAVYLEVDSWVPNAIAPFLTNKDRDPKEYNGVKGERLRTVKLRGQLSQGLLLPISIFEAAGKGQSSLYKEDDDVTDVLGIIKWEKEIPAQLRGQVEGAFPNFIRKTDQERIQNLTKELEKWKVDGSFWEVTEKLDGSSMTVYVKQIDPENPHACIEAGVCSRNYDLKMDENNTFWKTALDLDLIDKLQESGRSLALQGELVGPGIQGNQYGFTEHKFFVFDIYDINKQEYMLPIERHDFCLKNNILHVPKHDLPIHLYEATVEELLKVAEGSSAFNDSKREGLVFKHTMQHDVSFKVISNSWLLENE